MSLFFVTLYVLSSNAYNSLRLSRRNAALSALTLASLRVAHVIRLFVPFDFCLIRAALLVHVVRLFSVRNARKRETWGRFKNDR